MQFSPQQSKAILDVKAWLEATDGPQVFHLFGYAGSGKTTLAREITGLVDGNVLFGAFTGKAAMVLKTKGCDNAQTIHSMIYKCVSPPYAPPKFELMEADECKVSEVDLVIVDEVSMVGKELGEDLCSFGTKILVLGDPGQLPPIEGTGYFDTREPEVMLTEIHRQAQDNPIIRMSIDIRTGKGVKLGRHGESEVLHRSKMHEERLIEAQQVLVGLNATRRAFNRRIREMGGFEPVDSPTVNDKLICLRNNRSTGLLNGGLWTVDRVSGFSDGCANMEVKSLDIEGKSNEVSVPLKFFTGHEHTLDWKFRRKKDEFDFGYAITVHKSQGSQWPSVLIYNENRAFRENASRWLYTAVTRASERVTLVL